MLFFILFVSGVANAGDNEKLDAAAQLQQAASTTDVAQVVGIVMQAIINQSLDAFPGEVQSEMKTLLTEIATSDDYKRAKARVYAENFTLDEIRELTAIVQSPAFRRYQELLPKITSDSARQMNVLMQQNQETIQQRLQGAWERSSAR